MFSIRIKILVGYAVLAVVLVSATWMVYENTLSLSAVNRASEQLLARRDVVDSLVYSMLDCANAERSVLLGDASQWTRFDSALDSSSDKVRRLRPMVAGVRQRQRLDSLVSLLAAKRENTMLVMAELGKDSRDAYYRNKVRALQSGLDSVVIHPRVEDTHTQHETVYEIVRSKRGFFNRLGDAFRRQHADTIGTTRVSRQPTTDTVAHRLDIADSVASALAEIRHEEQRANSRQQIAIADRNDRLQRVSILLARRTGDLLEDIQSDEHQAMRHAVERAVESRRTMMVKILCLGLLAILSAAILVVYIMRDIRRERRDHERIVEANAATERIMQQRERLLLTITHDIKAPAASIAGFIDLLGEYVDNPKATGYLRNISGSAKHLQQLVSALLDYHQLESGKAEIHVSSFSPATLVGECVAEMQPLAIEKRLCLKADVRVGVGLVCRSDAFRIKQVVSNLVGNAIKYTDSGSVTVTVAASGCKLVVSVADTGCGMTADEQKRIFNAFTRLGNASGKDGVGLGLSITREIVERLGGTVGVVSSKGHGSKFTVVIPVETDNRHDHPAAGAAGGACCQSHGGMPVQGDTKVLIVDDDRLQIQLLVEMLSRVDGMRFDITTAMRAPDAIEAARKESPSIVFTDIELPDMNGVDIMRHMRVGCHGSHGSMAFVAMTAHEPSIAPQLRHEGFDACLFKPFSVQTLAATICQLTGVAVKPLETAADGFTAGSLHAALMPFTDGDADAERQIIGDMRRSIDEYLALLDDTSDSARVAQAAHKAMPLLEMLQPGANGWLARLTPEHIAGTDALEVERLAGRLKDKLLQILGMSE